MPVPSQKSLLGLSQSNEIWLFSVYRLRSWIKSKAKEPVRPYLLITYSRTSKMILEASIVEKPDIRRCRKNLFGAIIHPAQSSKLQSQRPAKVVFDDRVLLQALAASLQEIGIQSTYYPRSIELGMLVSELEASMNKDRDEIPGLFSGTSTTPELFGHLFDAAAIFYQVAPWILLGNDDALAVQVHPQKEPYYVIVMGQGGSEYGLSLFLQWTDLERFFLPYDNPEEIIPPGGAHNFFFNEIFEIPFDDLDAIEKYGWTVVDKQAYPFPAIFDLHGHVRRPNREEVLWYEAALRAIPEFVQKYLTKNNAGELMPVNATIKVPTMKGQKDVKITFPAGELPLDIRPIPIPGDGFEKGKVPISFDRRAFEGDLARLFDTDEDSDIRPDLKNAQALMYQAWGEQNPAKRLALAHQALRVSEDCTDAYVLLAEEEADSYEHAFELLKMAVDAGERTLGADFFKENAGCFWGLLETRPYMRAMEGSAYTLWELKRKEESLSTYHEMLRLNPSDNQGIRYALVDRLLEVNRGVELERLMKQYASDWSAVWLYTQALLAFRENGDSKKATQNLSKALKENPFVPAYLTGKKRIPIQLPEKIVWGDESEAIDYAAIHLNHWRSTPGAMEWLKNFLKK